MPSYFFVFRCFATVDSDRSSLIQVVWEDDFMAVIVKPQGVAVRPRNVVTLGMLKGVAYFRYRRT